MKQLGRDARTARLAVSAAALALAGLVLAASARWSANSAVDEARVEAGALAERLAALLSTAVSAARARAEGLAAWPAVREILYTDEATARAEGFALPMAAGETFEVVQLARRRAPRTLYRAPDGAPPLGIARANEVRIDEHAGALRVTVAVPAQPMYAREGLRGAVGVAMHVDLTQVTSSLRTSGLAVELVGAGAPLALSLPPPGDDGGGALVSVSLPAVEGAAARLSLRARVHTGGGAALWAGRALLLAAFAAAALTFVAFRRRAMPTMEDAPTTRRRHTPRAARIDAAATQVNAPAAPMALGPTARQKRGHPAAREEVTVREEMGALGWAAPMPTPITQLRPSHESAPIVVDPRGDLLASRYRLLRPIGRGHAADVYLAQSFVPGAGGTVALKLLDGRDQAARDAFLEVARRQMGVVHGNVARVFDVGDGEPAYVAMEYVEGCTLDLVLGDLFARDEPLPLPQTIAIVSAICRALGAARPLVHGALKPSNVLIGRHNAVKLADFGAPARVSDGLAPEQYAGRPADRRSDVYAVGLLLHALATGRRLDLPAPGDDASRWPPLPAPSTIRPTLPRTLDAVVAKATRFGPRGRYGSAAELLEALHDAAAGAASAASAARLGDWVDRARRA